MQNATVSLLETALKEALRLIEQFSLKADFFLELQVAFGRDITLDLTEFKKLLNELPQIQVRPSAEINGARGAYAKEVNQIYLSKELVERESLDPVVDVLLEEIGHYLDSRLNSTDAPGDEGAIFAALMRGVELNQGQLQSLKSEDDTITVQLDGEALQLEQDNYELGLLQGVNSYTDTLYYGGAEDYYTFTIGGTGRTSSQVEVTADSTNIDLVLELYDTLGNSIVAADVNTAANNNEVIPLVSFAPGTYTARVSDYFGGEFVNPNAASYVISIAAPTATDPYEFNDFFAQAAVLDTADGGEYITGLAIDDPTDVDWFQFTTTGLSSWEHFVQINFNHAAGDLAIALWDQYGGYYPVDTINDSERISLAGLPADTYYLQIGSFEGHSNPSYELQINTPTPTQADEFEGNIYLSGNDSFDDAANFGSVDGIYSSPNLSIHTPTDKDWFRFETNAIGTFENYLAINFDSSSGDLDLDLYDAQGYLLGYSNDYDSDEEAVSLAGLPAGTYYAQIYSYSGQTDYDLTIVAPGTTSSSDRFDNNTRATAADFGKLQGSKNWQNLSIHEASDTDWYQFELDATGTRNNFVAIAFDNLEGDLDLELYDSAGTLLEAATGFRNLERISLQGYASGTYSVRVVGYEGAINPQYSLFINAPGETANNTAAEATRLSQITGLEVYDDLEISDESDVDWYRFRTSNTGGEDNSVRIDFSSREGDLDLALYSYSGTADQESGFGGNAFNPDALTEINISQGVSSQEEISLEGQAAGEYFVKVYGYDGDTGSYSLTIDAPMETGADSFEGSANNNTLDSATDLNSLIEQGQTTLFLPENSQDFLSIHQASDVDWFKFELVADGTESSFASLTLNHALGDLDLTLYDASGTKLDGSAGVSNRHAINLSGQAAGVYYLEVAGYNGATNPEYELTINAPLSQQRAEDAYESNDSREEAKGIGSGANTISNLSIHDSDDRDWFEFELSNRGNFSNAVRIDFNHGEGDLDIVLYDSTGAEIERSQGVTNGEKISLAGYTPGTYYLEIFRFDGEGTTDYQLYYDLPDEAEDWSERAANAVFDLRDVAGLQTWNELSIHQADVDWFEFTIAEAANGEHFAGILFDQTLGDLDLSLYQGDTLLDSAATNNSVEEVDLQGLAAGTYRLKIEGYNGATNPDYQLIINAPAEDTGDWAEENNTHPEAYELREIQGSEIFAGLSLHEEGDVDWFSFSTVGEGKASHAISLEFEHSRGNLTLQLYDSSGNLLDTSNSDSNRERISLDGRAAGEYFVEVSGERNPSYSLLINAPEETEEDWAEGNNSREAAYSLREINGALFLNDFSIDSQGDEDWFQFVLPQDAVSGQEARIAFDHFEGDLQLELFSSDGSSLGLANTNRNFEEISLAGKRAGTYYVKVSGVNNAINPDYSLTITGIPEAQEDVAEGSGGNDTPGQAFDLRNISEINIQSLDSRNPYHTPPTSHEAYGSLMDQQLEEKRKDNRVEEAYAASNRAVNKQNYFFKNPDAPQMRSIPPTYSQNSSSNYSREDDLEKVGITLQSFGSGYDKLLPESNSISAPRGNHAPSNNSGNFQPPLTGGRIQRPIQPALSIDDFAAQAQQNKQFANYYPYPYYSFPYSYFYPPQPFGFQGYGKPIGPGNLFLSSETEEQFLTIIPDLSIETATDQDWFEFSLQKEGSAGQFIAINFDHDLGDLQLELYEAFDDAVTDSQPYLVEIADSRSDSEEISLAGLVAGDYLIRVSGEENPDYLLTLSAPPAFNKGDFTETNAPNPPPHDLRTVEGSLYLTGLSIHEAADTDRFQFTTTASGKEGHTVNIDFSHSQGDLDLILYNQNGTEIIRSETTEGFEEISLAGLDAGTYQLQVFGYEGATNPNYSLLIDAPDPNIDPDSLENNDSIANATLLGQNGNISSLFGLTVHQNDTDYFKFTTTEQGTRGDSISIEFEHAQGDLDLELYNSDGTTRRAASDSTTDNKSISLADLEAGTYYAKVSGYENAINNYQLYLDAPIEADAAQNVNDWTILVYMTTSNLSEEAFSTINELEYAAAFLPSNVDIAVLWDQSEKGTTYSTAGSDPWGTTGQAIIQADTNPDAIATSFDTSIGEKITGDPEALEDFAVWATNAAPAENYALVMWNHGGGELGGFNVDDNDNHASDRLYTDELTQALGNLEDRGVNFNLIAFDACLMAMAEVAYVLRDYTDILVASEEAEEGSGYDYTSAFSVLQGNASQVTSEALASSLVDSFQQQYQGNRRGWDTHSAIDLGNGSLDELVAKLNTFTTAATNLTTDAAWNAIKDARDNASSFFPAPYYRDLGQFLDAIADSTADQLPASLKSAASEALEALQSLVIDKTSDRRGTQGLSAYLPDNGIVDTEYASRNQEFLTATGWNNFLDAFSTRGSSNRSAIDLDWAEANNVAARSHNFYTLSDDGHSFEGLSLHQTDDVDWFRFALSAPATAADPLAITHNAGGELNLSLYALGDRQNAISNYANLPAGEYLLKVEAAAIIPEYTLTIDAPGTVTGQDWVKGNHTPNKAEDLGAIASSTQVSGFEISSSAPDWFEFELPKINSDQMQPVQVTVNILGSSTLTAELFNPDDSTTPIASAVGTGKLQLTTPNPVPGQTYHLKIRQEDQSAAAYSLFFEPSALDDPSVPDREDEPPAISLIQHSGTSSPLNSVQILSSPVPTFADLDGDGDLDLFTGEVNGQILHYRNDDGNFNQVTGSDNPLDGIDVGFVSTPTFVDIDGDGDLDLFSGEFNGTILFFRNDGGAFVEQIGAANPFNGVDIGTYSNIAFADIDGDGDEDAFLGLADGTVAYYRNDGGAFTPQQGTLNPLNGIDVGEPDAQDFSFPSFADVDGDGDEDALIGEVFGRVRYYENEGGAFTERTGSSSPLEDIRLGFYAAPAFADIDGDGDVDAAIGSDTTITGDSRGRVSFFENTTLGATATLMAALGTDEGLVGSGLALTELLGGEHFTSSI